jgi:transposase
VKREPPLFEDLAVQRTPQAAIGGRARVREPVRNQVEMQWRTLDEQLPEDHRARQVWSFVERLDLSDLYRGIKAVEGRPGHPPADPRLLMGLWLYATLEQVGSARQLDRLCREHLGFRWMCGGVGVNYHLLADFRVAHGAVLERLLTQSFAACLEAGLADLDRVAQDGMRVRASAGAASFRRQRTLQECHDLACAELARLRSELAADPGAASRRQQAARLRAAREREERVAAALQAARTLAAQQPAAKAAAANESSGNGPGEDGPSGGTPKVKEPRASSTDVEARVMKMADGGFRPAFNVQIATSTRGQLIAAVSIGASGSDQGQMAPMVEQLTACYGRPPKEILVDGGFTKLADIDRVSAAGTTIYAPLTKPRDPGRDPHAPRPKDSAHVIGWRARMGTARAKTIYKDRAATAECVNALARNRGLQRFVVRGLQKARAVVLWFALAHNMMRSLSLAAATT